MATFKVYPYRIGSRSAKQLAEALEGKVLKHAGSKYRPRVGDIVVNWGASNPPALAPATTLNREVQVAQCKLATFKALQEADIRTPLFWENQDDIPAEAYPVFARTVLRGHSGRGIVLLAGEQDQVAAPLYVQYKKKKHEFRVHVCGTEAFFIQRKAKRRDIPADEINWQVRNLEGGFVFAAVDREEVPNEVIELAQKSIEALGLDFGGVDVIWNEREARAYVLEVNTACGLEPRTAELYSEVLERLWG